MSKPFNANRLGLPSNITRSQFEQMAYDCHINELMLVAGIKYAEGQNMSEIGREIGITGSGVLNRIDNLIREMDDAWAMSAGFHPGDVDFLKMPYRQAIGFLGPREFKPGEDFRSEHVGLDIMLRHRLDSKTPSYTLEDWVLKRPNEVVATPQFNPSSSYEVMRAKKDLRCVNVLLERFDLKLGMTRQQLRQWHEAKKAEARDNLEKVRDFSPYPKAPIDMSRLGLKKELTFNEFFDICRKRTSCQHLMRWDLSIVELYARGLDRFQIRGLFNDEKSEPIETDSTRHYQAIVDFAIEKVNRFLAPEEPEDPTKILGVPAIESFAFDRVPLITIRKIINTVPGTKTVKDMISISEYSLKTLANFSKEEAEGLRALRKAMKKVGLEFGMSPSDIERWVDSQQEQPSNDPEERTVPTA